MNVKFYSKDNCSLCDKGFLILKDLASEFSLQIEVIDIYQDDALLEKYQIMIPVVEINDVEVDYGILSKGKIRSFLEVL